MFTLIGVFLAGTLVGAGGAAGILLYRRIYWEDKDPDGDHSLLRGLVKIVGEAENRRQQP